jgi:hypothetical protein
LLRLLHQRSVQRGLAYWPTQATPTLFPLVLDCCDT